MESTAYLKGNNTEHYFQNEHLLTSEQEKIVRDFQPVINLDTIVKNAYKSYFMDKYYQSIKASRVSLAALTEIKHNHFRMILDASLTGETASYCFIDLGTIYAKIGLDTLILERSLEIFSEAFIENIRININLEQCSYSWSAINEAYQLLFFRYKEIALAAYEYYSYLQTERIFSEQAPLSVRTVEMSPEHLLIYINPLSDYLSWHEISDYALTLMNQHQYRHVYLDLSGLTGRELDEKDLIIFDFQQYCFIKSIELYVIGMSDFGEDDLLAQSDDIQEKKVHFFSDLEHALLCDRLTIQ